MKIHDHFIQQYSNTFCLRPITDAQQDAALACGVKNNGKSMMNWYLDQCTQSRRYHWEGPSPKPASGQPTQAALTPPAVPPQPLYYSSRLENDGTDFAGLTKFWRNLAPEARQQERARMYVDYEQRTAAREQATFVSQWSGRAMLLSILVCPRPYFTFSGITLWAAGRYYATQQRHAIEALDRKACADAKLKAWQPPAARNQKPASNQI